ncbi:MAG: DNA ligase [Methanosaeta sp. PtaU1.Bin060]|nr:MAG: DNA ligase [Methanosaeta sp. PtaU1.Bin060]
MLAVSGKPFSSEGWIFEPKIDGTRCIASAMNGLVLQNRRLVNITFRYPEIAETLADASGCIFDGEIAIFSDGRPDFALLSEREHLMEKLRIDYLSRARPASFVVFDILFAQGKSVMDRPLVERKSILSQELEESEQVTLIDYFPEKGEKYFQAALKVGIEGVMAKRADSVYQPGVRSPDWVKIKKQVKLDLVVGGYIQGKGSRQPYFGGLLLGAYRSGELVYVGRVGSGFSEQELQMISGDFEPIAEPPFSSPPRIQGVVWLKPKSVVQVAAMEVTENGSLRAPVFLRAREDKEPDECTLDQIKM